MPRPLNPFEPNRPALPDQFVGREKEVAELETALVHLKQGCPRNFLITGFRGVGKTSFLDWIRRRASRGSGEFKFLVIDFLINKKSTGADLAKGIERELARAVSAYEPLRDLVKRAWGFAQRIEAGGVSIKSVEEKSDSREIYEAVAEAMCETVEKLCESMSVVQGYDGVLLLFDEVDQAPAGLDLGTFLKYFSEIMHRRGCHKVGLGLAGLASSRAVLLESHPSSLRIFDELPLDNLKEEEFNELIGYVELKVQNSGMTDFRVTDDAKKLLYHLSDGHPHFVHQFGYCAFEHAVSNFDEGQLVLVAGDVQHGAFDHRGALDLIGDMYFAKAYERIESDGLAISILDVLCEHPRRLFGLSELCIQIDCERESLISLLGRLCDLSLIQEVRGSYRVRFVCFAYWLKDIHAKVLSS